MKVYLLGAYKHNGLIADIVTDALRDTITGPEFCKVLSSSPDTSNVDVVLTINGYEVNLFSFCKNWKERVEQLMKEGSYGKEDVPPT